MRRLFILLCLPAIAHAECDKLSIVDAKALTQEQLKGRICRDMSRRNFYVDSANDFLKHDDMVQTIGGGLKITPHAGYYGAWLAQLKQGAACSAAVQSNTETYSDLYADAPGCEAPHAAQRLEFVR